MFAAGPPDRVSCSPRRAGTQRRYPPLRTRQRAHGLHVRSEVKVPPEFPPVSPGHSPPPPIADYELLRLIGRGSYGDVWLARGVTGVFRAVKIVWRDRFADVRPYEREFEGITRFAAISLREPSQLALLHAGRQDAAGFFYYVMELADDTARGREIDPARYAPCTLRDFAAGRGQRLEIAEVVALGTALARALASLHAAGLVHRDIKPSNVILVGGVPKFADVGLVAPASAQLTFVGTEGFVPPEGPGAPSADVYSLGKLLYELATGLDRHDYPRLPPDLDARPDRAALLELNEVLVRACEPDARRRFTDAGEMLDELLLLQAGKSVRRLRRAERRTARALRFAAVLAVIAGLAGAGAWIERKRAEDETKLRLAAEAERDALARKAAYSASIERAQILIETSDLAGARTLLANVQPKSGQTDLRSFEWHALWREAQGDPADVLIDSGPEMQRARISREGKTIAGQDATETVTLWDPTARTVKKRISKVFRLTGFSADGRWLVGQTNLERKALLQRWSVATGEPDGTPTPDASSNWPLASLGDDRIICFSVGSATVPHALRIWDFAARRDVQRVPLPRDPTGTNWNFYQLEAASVSADGRYCAVTFVSTGESTTRWKVEVLEIATGRVVFREATLHRIVALAISSNGTKLAVSLGDTAELRLLDVTSGAWIWKTKFARGPGSVLAFSPDDLQIAAGGPSCVEIFGANAGDTIAHLRGNGAGVKDVAWLPDGNRLFSAGTNGDLRLWHPGGRVSRHEFSGLGIPAGGGRRLIISSDGSRLMATDAVVKKPVVFANEDFSSLGRGPSDWLPVAFVGSNSEEAIGVRPDGVMERRQIHPTLPWPLLEEAKLFDGRVTMGSGAVLSANGHVLVVGSRTGQVVFWDLLGRRRIASVDSGNTALGFVAVSPDGRFALTGGTTRTLARMWDVHSGEHLFTIANTNSRPFCGAFAADGQHVAVGWSDGSIEIHSRESTKLVRRIQTRSSLVQCVAFSPDGSRLLGGAPNGNLHVFATDDAREVLTLRIPASDFTTDNRLVNLAFSGDGNVLAGYVTDGRIRLWRR